MNKLLDLISKHLEDGNYLLIIVALVLVIIFKFENLYKSFDKVKKSKLNFLLDIADKDYLDDTTKESVKEKINNLIFTNSTGISTNKFFRYKIMELYHQKKGLISLNQIRYALPFLNISNDSLIIEITKWNKLIFILNIIFGFILLFFGLAILSLLITISSLSFSKVLGLILIGLIFILVSFIPLKEASSYQAAKRIERLL